jgi:hypothetical protein
MLQTFITEVSFFQYYPNNNWVAALPQNAGEDNFVRIPNSGIILRTANQSFSLSNELINLTAIATFATSLVPG